MEIHKPTKQDWIKLQGGEPSITYRKNIAIVVHNYPGGKNLSVPSHKTHEMGSVIIGLGERLVEFPVFQVRALHGEPCQARSHAQGGRGYEKV